MTALTQQQFFEEVETLPIELKTKMIDTLWVEEVINRKQQIDFGEVTLLEGKEVFNKLALKFNV